MRRSIQADGLPVGQLSPHSSLIHRTSLDYRDRCAACVMRSIRGHKSRQSRCTTWQVNNRNHKDSRSATPKRSARHANDGHPRPQRRGSRHHGFHSRQAERSRRAGQLHSPPTTPIAARPSAARSATLSLKLPGTIRGPRRMLSAHVDTVPICVGSRPSQRRPRRERQQEDRPRRRRPRRRCVCSRPPSTSSAQAAPSAAHVLVDRSKRKPACSAHATCASQNSASRNWHSTSTAAPAHAQNRRHRRLPHDDRNPRPRRPRRQSSRRRRQRHRHRVASRSPTSRTTAGTD